MDDVFSILYCMGVMKSSPADFVTSAVRISKVCRIRKVATFWLLVDLLVHVQSSLVSATLIRSFDSCNQC